MGDWTGTVPTILAGSVPTGDDWDDVLDIETALVTAWTTYSCTWRSTGVQPAIGNGSVTAVYRRTGKTFDAKINLVIGSTSTFGTGTYYFDLPFTSVRETVGVARAFDSSAGAVFAAVGLVTALAGLPGLAYALPLTCSTNAVWSSAGPMTWATSDQGSIHVTADTA